MIRILQFLCILLFIRLEVSGQNPFVQVISHEKGFGNSSISKLLEDSQGVLWVGTQLGLLRFDGLQTTVFVPLPGDTNSLSNEYIYDIFEDHSGYMWVATRNGLNRIDPSRKKFKRYYTDTEDASSLPSNQIFQLQAISDSTFLVLCGQNGMASFNIHTERVRRMAPLIQTETLPKRYDETWTFQAFRTSNNFVFVRTNRGLYQYNRDLHILTDIQDTVTGFRDAPHIGKYCVSMEGIMWLADIYGNLYKWLPNQFLVSYADPQLAECAREGPFWMMEYDRQSLLISTAKKYLLIDKETGQARALQFRADQDNILEYGQVTALLETAKGIVVLGSNQGNLYMIDPLLQQFKYKQLPLDERTDSERPTVNSFFEDQEFGRRYYSVLSHPFFYVEDMTTHEINAFPKPLRSNIANKWMLDHTGRLWLCNGNALLNIDRTTHTISQYYPSVFALNLFEMVEISPGTMLVSSYRDGLYWFEPDHNVFEKLPEAKGWLKSQLYCLELDSKNTSVWIGTTDHGAFRYDITRDTFYHYEYHSRNPQSIGGEWVKDIALDSLGYVWFSVDPAGLCRFDYRVPADSAFIRISIEDGLPTNFITGLRTDLHGTLWMTSINGIASLNPANFHITHYAKSDGLPKTRFTQTNLFVTPDNLVLIGAPDGYFYFNPDSLVINETPPELVIRDILASDRSRLQIDRSQQILPIKLNYRENYLAIQFSVVNYTEPELNTVKYIMEGLDEDWNIRSGIHQVNYTKVPPGDYVFRILAANNDGVWNTRESTMSITITPPFWQRTWFYLLVGALVTSMIYALYQYKLRQTVKEKLLLAEQERIKSEASRQLGQLEMKALRAQMNPHFIFNCLNSINRFIVVNDNDTASEYLTKFSRLIRQVLDNSRGEKIVLANEIDTLKLYIEMESLRFINKFEYHISIDPALEVDAFVIQPMLIQPYVENAIWHGLMHRKTKGILQLSFFRKGSSLLVVIEDNGVGRAMAKSIKESQLITRKSHGMKVTAERMSLLSKTLNVPVEAVVEDLHDAESQPTGTKVNLLLPLEPISDNLESQTGPSK